MATSDANIILGVKPVQVPNALEQYAQVSQIQGLNQRNRLAEMKIGEAERVGAERVATADAYRNAISPDGTVDRTKLFGGLAAGGQGAAIPGLQKTFNDTDKSALELKASKIADGLKKFEVIGQISAGVRDQATYDQARQQIAQVLGPDAVQNMSPIYDPQAIEAGRVKAMSVKDQLAKEFEAVKFQYQQQNDTANRGVTMRGQDMSASTAMRGQNMVDVRGREANALKGQENAINREGINAKRTQDVEMKLGDDYRAQSKNFRDVMDATRRVETTLDSAAKSPAATLAAATSFMKLLDPGSVVRESELGMALAATGVFDRATNYYNTLARGQVLTPNQVKDFKTISGQISQAARQGQQQVDESYRAQATQYGARPEMVIQQLGQGAKVPANAGSHIDSLLDKYK